MTQQKIILVLDSSQLDTFDNCPTEWHYRYQEGLMPNRARPTTPMDMGTYGHKLLEIYYKLVAGNTNPIDAMNAALAFDIDKETCRCSHNREKHSDKGYTPLIGDGLLNPCQTIGCTCQSFEGIEFPLTPQEREQVRNRFLEYCMVEGTALPALRPHSPEHVEIGFSKKIYEDEKRLYILEGRVDFVGQIANNVPDGWGDHKWQIRERDLYLSTIQFRNYSLVLQKELGIVNYVRLAKKFEPGKTFKRDIISFSRVQTKWWEARLIEMFNRVEKAVTGHPSYFDEEFGTGEKNWQWYVESDALRRRSACSGKYGYFCPYTPICENAGNAQFIKLIEQTDFQKKPIWRPW